MRSRRSADSPEPDGRSPEAEWGFEPELLEFNMERSLRTATRYLDGAPPYRDIRLMLFNHGVEAVGLPTAEEWAGVFDRALHHGGWVGADPAEFPMDYAQFART